MKSGRTIRLVKKYRNRFRDRIYPVSAISREGGFINGVKYAVTLMAEYYADQKNITLKLL